MGGAPCIKLLANSGSVIGILHGLMSGVNNATAEGTPIPDDIISKGESLICGFHKELLAYEQEFLAAVKS